MSSPALPAPSATCATDGSTAEGVCVRCGGFVCPKCRRWQAEQALCTSCRERLGDRASPSARLSLLLATIGLVTLVPGIPAVVLAQQELGRIRRCESSDAGEVHVRFARGLGLLEGALLLFVAAMLFLRFA